MAGLNTAQIIDEGRRQGVNLSDSDAQDILKSAWDQSQWGADAGKVSSLISSRRGSGGGGGGGGGSSYGAGYSAPTNTFNWDDVLKKATEMYQSAYQPVVSSLEGAIPKFQEQFGKMKTGLEQQKTDLQTQYDKIIEDIKGGGKVAEESQIRATNAEMARRGITGGIQEQEIAGALRPVAQQTQSAISSAGLNKTNALSSIAERILGIGGEAVSKEQELRSKIAEILSGAKEKALAFTKSAETDWRGQQLSAKDLAEIEYTKARAANELAQSKQYGQPSGLSSLFNLGQPQQQNYSVDYKSQQLNNSSNKNTTNSKQLAQYDFQPVKQSSSSTNKSVVVNRTEVPKTNKSVASKVVPVPTPTPTPVKSASATLKPSATKSSGNIVSSAVNTLKKLLGIK